VIDQSNRTLDRADYVASTDPTVVRIPRRRYLTIDVNGDVLSDLHELRSVAEAAAAAACPWRRVTYADMPLEGFWHDAEHTEFDPTLAGVWDWTAGICLPEDFDDEAVSRMMLRRYRSDEPCRVSVQLLGPGLMVQALHVGPYDTIGCTLEPIRRLAADQSLESSGIYQEVYLTDPRTTAPDDLRTIVRQPVRRRTGERRPPSILDRSCS
jgi:hypothetical protein